MKKYEMKCPYCKQKIDTNSKVCPECGKDLKIINRGAGILLVVLIVIIGIAIVTNNQKVSNTKIKSSAPEIKQSEKNLKEIKTKLNLDEKESKAIYEVFNKIEINHFDYTIEKIGKWDGELTTQYTVKLNERNNAVLYLNDDNTINKFVLKDNYYIEENKIKNSYYDYNFREGELDNLKDIAMTTMIELYTPNNIRFGHSEWKHKKEDGIFYIEGTITGKNALGVKVKETFQLKVNANDKVESMYINGEKQF